MQVKQLDFTGTTIFCGIDVHKNSWRVNIQDGSFELEDFSQNPDAVLLHKHLLRKYPGANFKLCYEAGFSGFSAQRWFNAHDIDCQVVNAADVATSDKEKRRKNDKTDARKLCEHLQSKKMSGVYIPTAAFEYGRALVRAREKIVRDQTRCKNRIRHLLHVSGLALPDCYDSGCHWSNGFVQHLQQLDCGSTILKSTLDLYIKNFIQTRTLLLEATRAVRNLCKRDDYVQSISLIRTVPGIGQINAAVILFELQNILRFKHMDHLCSYAGLVPDTSDSGDTKITKGITNRGNHYLRDALVESAWVVIRKDPALLMKYKNYCRRMPKNKAIIRVAVHLLTRIRWVLKNKKQYVSAVIG